MLIQLDLFEERTEIQIMEEKFRLLEKSMDKTRKSIFAKHGTLCKQYLELNDRFDVLERALCRGKYGVLE
jgi:hypothetical protein